VDIFFLKALANSTVKIPFGHLPYLHFFQIHFYLTANHLLTTVFKFKHVHKHPTFVKSRRIGWFTLRFAPGFPILHSLSIASVKLETSFFLVFKLYMLSLFLPIHILLPIKNLVELYKSSMRVPSFSTKMAHTGSATD